MQGGLAIDVSEKTQANVILHSDTPYKRILQRAGMSIAGLTSWTVPHILGGCSLLLPVFLSSAYAPPNVNAEQSCHSDFEKSWYKKMMIPLLDLR